MEIVLNFEKKEIAVNEDCNFLELHKKLKKLLGDDLIHWTITGPEVNKLTWDTIGGTVTYGKEEYPDNIVCFSDNKEYAEG